MTGLVSVKSRVSRSPEPTGAVPGALSQDQLLVPSPAGLRSSSPQHALCGPRPSLSMAKLATGPQLGTELSQAQPHDMEPGSRAWSHFSLRSWAWLEEPVAGAESGGPVPVF